MKRSKLVLLVMLEISLAFTAGSVLLAEDTLETAAKGIRILPGQWRPHYPWEHIAWVSPPWPTQDYIWLDLPEAVFVESDLLFLSHINPPFPARYTNLPKVQWKTIVGGIAFERVLPNSIKFGGSVTKNADSTGCSLQIFIENGSSEPLKDIKLQTCIISVPSKSSLISPQRTNSSICLMLGGRRSMKPWSLQRKCTLPAPGKAATVSAGGPDQPLPTCLSW